MAALRGEGEGEAGGGGGVTGLVLNAICPLVCFSNMVTLIEIASQRVEEPPVLQTTRSGRKPGHWSKRLTLTL